MGIVIRRNGTDTDRGLRPGPTATGHGDQRQRLKNGQHRLATPRGAVLYKPANAGPKAVVPPHGSEYAAIYSRYAKLIHQAWGDGIHLKVRLEQEKLCLLVMIGVRSDGRKELVALTDGFRESTESWADLLRSCRRRGMAAPVLAVGDGALGFWKAMREVFPETREQRCWFHKQANVLAALPKSAHPGALAAMREIYNAEDIDKAQVAIKAFEIDYGAKHPKAVAKIVDDLDGLL